MQAFDSWVRVGSFAVGFLGVVAFFQSILRVALLHRRQGDWLATSNRKSHNPPDQTPCATPTRL